jgi:hypothetical protein
VEKQHNGGCQKGPLKLQTHASSELIKKHKMDQSSRGRHICEIASVKVKRKKNMNDLNRKQEGMKLFNSAVN